jgi:RHS repeat-associated protein
VAGDGTYGFSGDGGPATSAEVSAMGVALSPSGNLYIADGSNRIREVGPSAAIPALTWQTPAAISYGTALSSTQLNATANVPGTFTYSPAIGTLLEAGSHTLLATFTPGDITDYDTTTAMVALTVNQATPTISWGPPASIVNGTALSTTQLNATANVPGTLAYSPAAGTVLAAGSHTLSVTFVPNDATDYTTSTATAYITVTQPTGTWDSGTIALTVNDVTVAATSYGQGSTPSSISQELAANVSAASPVNVTAVGDSLYIEAKATGSASNYSYSLQTTSYNSTIFSQPSFLGPNGISGTLDGGQNQNTTASPVYNFSVPAGGYDGVGNLTNYSDSVMGAWSFSYDSLNRLSAATQTPVNGSAQSFCWTFDGFGNRTAQATSNQPFTNSAGASACQLAAGATLLTNIWANYSTSNNNQLANTSQSTAGIAYDPAGNITNDGANQYLYDGEGRICAVAQIASGVSTMTGYIYNAEGQRVGKGTITSWSCDPAISGFAPTSDYILGPSGEQVTEMGVSANNTMAWQHTNVFAAGSLIATYDNDGLHFYLNDSVGTRRAQTDYAGVLEQSCFSLPFGDSLACSNSAQYPTEHHFTGKERDAESGLDYFGARYYASSMGRFLSPDWSARPNPVPYAQLTNPQTLNLYEYGDNNPLSHTDPDGHCSIGGKDYNGWFCFWHKLGFAETPEEQHADAENERKLIASKHLNLPDGKPIDANYLSQVSDKNVWDLANLLAGQQYDQTMDSAMNSLAAALSLMPGGGKGFGSVDGESTSTENVLKQAEDWLGPNYKEIDPGVYRSADGMRQFRMTTSDLTDPRQGPHVHFESIGPDGRVIQENSHVKITNP